MKKRKTKTAKAQSDTKPVTLTMPIDMKLALVEIATISKTSLDQVVAVLIATAVVRGERA